MAPKLEHEQQNQSKERTASAKEIESQKPSVQLKAASYAQGKAALSPGANGGFESQQAALKPPPVQMKGGDIQKKDVHEIAAQGTQGGGSALPHGDKIQAAFGRHDVSGVQAHTGGAAAEANKSMGAEAYASGNNIAFKGAPDLHTAAHEAAHIVQQRGGVSLDGGVGKAGDSYEQHADSVADAVVSGQNAEGLLDRMAGGGAGATQATQQKSNPIQYFRRGGDKATDKGVNGWRIGENEEVAASQETGEGGYQLFTAAGKINTGNAALTSAKSGIILTKGPGTVKVGGKTLVEAKPTLNPAVATPDDGKLKDINAGKVEADDGSKTSDKLGLWADCGRASRVTTGGYVGANYKSGGKDAQTGKAGSPAAFSDEIYFQSMNEFLADPKNLPYLVEGIHFTDKSDPSSTIISPSTAKQARAQFIALSAGGTDAFSAAFGINEYANPDVGETYTMATEYDMPGFKYMGATWNFHWAGVIMKDGSDNITCEGYAIDPSSKIKAARQKYNKPADAAKLRDEIAQIRKWASNYIDRDFRIQMYGTTKKDQTFHHEHSESNTHGSRNSTFEAGK
jgi:hypothetical protein